MILEVTFCALIAGAPNDTSNCEVAQFPLISEVKLPMQCDIIAQEVIAKQTETVWQGYRATVHRCVPQKRDQAAK